MRSSQVGARLRDRLGRGNGGWRLKIAAEANPAHPDLLPDFRFFAVIKTWMDEDIIEATVRSAFIQGAEEVFIVDNGSTDDTVSRAESSGAVLAESYTTDVFEGRIAQVLINAVIARQSLLCGAQHVWWLLLDTDEFPEGPDGMSIIEYLRTLDSRFRLVGSKYFNHLPSGKPEYISGFHPIDFQPLCEPFTPVNPPCDEDHWKHPLQRFDRDGLFITSADGFHTASVRTEEPLTEPLGGIVTHHFQYRDEAVTRAKLEWTCGPNSTRTALHESLGHRGFTTRRKSLDAVYDLRWKDIDSVPNIHRSGEPDPRPWSNAAGIRRWYPLEKVETARQRWQAEPGVTGLAGDR